MCVCVCVEGGGGGGGGGGGWVGGGGVYHDEHLNFKETVNVLISSRLFM